MEMVEAVVPGHRGNAGAEEKELGSREEEPETAETERSRNASGEESREGEKNPARLGHQYRACMRIGKLLLVLNPETGTGKSPGENVKPGDTVFVASIHD